MERVMEVRESRALCGGLLAGAGLLLLTSRCLSGRRLREKLREAGERREEALRSLQETRTRLAAQYPVADRSQILELPLADLVQKLQDEELTPEAVLHTYMEQALEATGRLNCVTDYLPACEAQLSRLRDPDSRGPLYGVPVSLKDNYNCQGHDSTLGLVRNLGRPVEEDAVLVTVLKQLGAIPFVKTNVPQSMLNYDCSNPLFGQTLNPLDPRKTPGGSSGGEGALIAAGGSILGFGSDIGGSIRFPSAFCGLCGLKPTSNRLSNVGVVCSSPGQKAVTAMVGPMARDVDSLVIAMRALLCDVLFQLDPTVPPLPFNDKVYSSTRPLRIGYYETDDSTLATPSMRRAVLQTKELLERAGHQLVPFNPPSVEESLYDLALKGLLADGGSTFLDNFKGDRVDPHLRTQVYSYAIPSWLKSLLSVLVWPVFPRLAKVLQRLRGVRSVKDLWKQHSAVEAYRRDLLSLWKEEGLDALICPILGPALSIGYPGQLSTAVSYTILYNLLNFPAGVVPVTTVTREDEEQLQHYRGHYRDLWDKLLKKHGEVDSGRILTLSLEELIGQLKSGSLSPEAVLHTYIEKALSVTREVNCVTDFLVECEAQLQEVKKQPEKGPLYGVPISIKDNIGCKGHNSNLGMVHFLGRLAEEDSVIVQVLKKQGAVPFVMTSVPQSLIIFDCSNSIYGQTLNPLNPKKTCGGSSGGEGALVAGGGSILGVGTDVLGSIRMPSSFCGICGFKPSGDRLTERGFTSPVSGMKSAVNMPGPMARDVESLAIFMKALLCDDLFHLDPSVPPVPFRDEIYRSSKRLTIGFYDTDGYFLPHPSTRRAIQETKSLLEEAGHKLVPFTPPRIEYALNELCIRGFFADGGKTLAEKFSVKELWKHYTAIKEYRDEFVAEWRKLGLDGLLCPSLGPAFNLGQPGKLFAGFTFTMLFNVLNFPAGVLPVTKVTPEDEEELKHYKGYFNDPWDKEAIKGMEDGVGLPVSVQCVTLQWQEELCLRLMKEVENVTRGNLKI